MAEAPTDAAAWIELQLPASLQALAPLQAVLRTQALALGFADPVCQRMHAACEEALSTILHLSHDHAEDAQQAVRVHLSVDDSALQLRLSDDGLPYDPSLLPHYNPTQPETAREDAAGLSAFLMQKLTDRCQIVNLGQHGHHVQLEWLRPRTAAAGAAPTSAAAPTPAEPVAPGATIIRPLHTNDAIHLARLVFRSYGYSYVNPDLYLAEGILARVASGRLTSWVAAPANGGPPVGHIAFMKGHRDDDTLEVGTAVVAPDQRGTGLLGRLLSTATEALLTRPERAAFVHAVTAHPFTQKTFGRLGYLPTALLLAYTPASLHFRSIAGRPEGQRGSVYYACRLLRPIQTPIDIHLPEALVSLVLPRAAEIGLPLRRQTCAAPVLDAATSHIEALCEPALNAAFLTVHRAGSDFATALRRKLRELCRARFDVLYLSLDLRQPASAAACAPALELGFIPAGLTPFMPWPATLCLQYLNNLDLQEDAVCAVGPAAEALRQQAFAAWRAIEGIADNS